jgi:hypothetical protein
LKIFVGMRGSYSMDHQIAFFKFFLAHMAPNMQTILLLLLPRAIEF